MFSASRMLTRFAFILIFAALFASCAKPKHNYTYRVEMYGGKVNVAYVLKGKTKREDTRVNWSKDFTDREGEFYNLNVTKLSGDTSCIAVLYLDKEGTPVDTAILIVDTLQPDNNFAQILGKLP